MTLYKVICRGMEQGPHHHGIAYVVANDPTEAHRLLSDRLASRNLGFSEDRALKSIEVIAAEGSYPDCGYQLLIRSPLGAQESP